MVELLPLNLLHSERPKLYTILAFLSAIGLKYKVYLFTLIVLIRGILAVAD